MSDWNSKQLLEYATNVCEELAKADAEIAKLKQQCGVFQEYEPLATYSKFYDMTKESEWSRFCADYETDKVKAEQNTIRQKENAALLEKLVALIKGTGIPSTSWEWKRNKRVSVECNWLSLLTAAAPRDARTLAMLEKVYQENKAKYEAYLKVKADAEKEQERLRLQDEAEQKRIREESKAIVQCADLLGVDVVTATVESLLQAIRDKDKYIDLALAGMQVRGDWNDGPDAVESALGRFQTESEVDSAIVRNWQDQVSDFDDGRQFRDCTWGYDRVFELASDEAKAAYSLISDYVRLNQYAG